MLKIVLNVCPIAFSQAQFQPQKYHYILYCIFNHLLYVRSKDKYQFSISPPRCAWKFSWVMSELFDFPEIVEYKLKKPFFMNTRTRALVNRFFHIGVTHRAMMLALDCDEECLKLRKKKKTYKWHILMSFSFMTSLYVTQSLNLW